MNEIRVGADVVIYFNDENAAPYRMFGKYLHTNDEAVVIEGTVGDYIGKNYEIPRSNIKMIEFKN